MIKIIVPFAFTILVFLFLGIVLFLTKYKRRNKEVTPGKAVKGCGCCSDSSCCSEKS